MSDINLWYRFTESEVDAQRWFDGEMGYGPALTCTRAGATATRVNAQGLVELVAANQPRFTYNPVTKECEGLLVEQARTNVVTNSRFGTGQWTEGNVTLTPASTVAPDGTLTGVGVTESTDVSPVVHSNYFLYSTGNPTLPWCASTYWKPVNLDRGLRVLLLDHTGGISTFINVTSEGTVKGTTVGNGATLTDYGIEEAGDGWYRVWVAGVVNSAAGATDGVRIILYTTTSATGATSYQAEGELAYYCWGAQLEQGSFVTSHIPTTTVGQTTARAADAISANVSARFVSGAPLTTVVRGTHLHSTTTSSFLYGLRGSDANSNYLTGYRAEGDNIRTYLYINDVEQPIATGGDLSDQLPVTEVFRLVSDDSYYFATSVDTTTDTEAIDPMFDIVTLDLGNNNATAVLIKEFICYNEAKDDQWCNDVAREHSLGVFGPYR